MRTIKTYLVDEAFSLPDIFPDSLPPDLTECPSERALSEALSSGGTT